METTTNASNETQTARPETFKVTSNWDMQSKELKTKFPQLTDDDLKFETGKESELLSKIQTKLNKSREEIIGIINNIPVEKTKSSHKLNAEHGI